MANFLDDNGRAAFLQDFSRLRAQIAIINITGVPTVATLVAQHLIKTVSPARLMSADLRMSRTMCVSTLLMLIIEVACDLSGRRANLCCRPNQRMRPRRLSKS